MGPCDYTDSFRHVDVVVGGATEGRYGANRITAGPSLIVLERGATPHYRPGLAAQAVPCWYPLPGLGAGVHLSVHLNAEEPVYGRGLRVRVRAPPRVV